MRLNFLNRDDLSTGDKNAEKGYRETIKDDGKS